MGGISLHGDGDRIATSNWLPTVGPLSGIAMQGVLWTTVIGGALASPLFTWPTDPFSIVGSGDGAVAMAFNVGLLASGVLALPFAAWLWRVRGRLPGALYGLTGLSFVAAGLFPIPSSLHEIAAGIFVFVWLLCWAAGVADWRRERRWHGAVQFALGVASVAVWLPYDFGIEWAMVGYGAAEAVALAVLTMWTLWTVHRH